MLIRQYNTLPQEAREIREEVFMKEQGFKNEFDEIDETAIHFVGFVENKPAATCRIFFSKENNSYMLGRLAVKKNFRGQHLGEKIVLFAECHLKEINAPCCTLFAQLQASKFYEKLGYQSFGEMLEEEGCPHIMMKKVF